MIYSLYHMAHGIELLVVDERTQKNLWILDAFLSLLHVVIPYNPAKCCSHHSCSKNKVQSCHWGNSEDWRFAIVVPVLQLAISIKVNAPWPWIVKVSNRRI